MSAQIARVSHALSVFDDCCTASWVEERQSSAVDLVTGATQSAEAFSQAVDAALVTGCVDHRRACTWRQGPPGDLIRRHAHVTIDAQ